MIKKRALYIVTAILILFYSLLVIKQLNTLEALPFSVQILMDGETETINLWESEDGTYYVFLPSYAVPAKVSIHMNTEAPVHCEGKLLYEGMPCDMFLHGKTYNLSFGVLGKDITKQVVFLYSKNVATMYVDIQSGNMEYIHEKKGNEEPGALRLYTPEGKVNYAGNLESINGRGNNTWEAFVKKPYNLNFPGEVDLLGMGKAQRWVLLANADDESNLRNKIVYDFAQDVGLAYSPDSQWVDLYLNGEYAGLYLLCERNEVHSQRIDIAHSDSFLVSLEVEYRLETQGRTFVKTENQQALRVHYPLTTTQEELQMLREQWQSVENAIMAEDGIDPVTGKSWECLIDLDSWVKKYLIEEIFCNTDGGFISQYFYRDGDDATGKIYAGPVWDYDHSMGTPVSWNPVAPNTLYANRLQVENIHETPWFHYLYQKDEFYDRMVSAYEEEFLPLLKKWIDQRMDAYATQISQAATMNQIRWFQGADTKSTVENIRSFMELRIAFLNRIWVEQEVYYTVKADCGFGQFYGYYIIGPGGFLPELPVLDNTQTHTFLGWYDVDTGLPVDPEQPVTEDMEIYAAWQEHSSKRLNQILKLVPLGVIAMLGAGFLLVELRRTKKSR